MERVRISAAVVLTKRRKSNELQICFPRNDVAGAFPKAKLATINSIKQRWRIDRRL